MAPLSSARARHSNGTMRPVAHLTDDDALLLAHCSDIHQLQLITDVIGTPSEEDIDNIRSVKVGLVS